MRLVVRTFCVAMLLAWAPRPAAAALDEGTEVVHPEARVVRLDVQASGLEVDEASVRQAITRELDLAAPPEGDDVPIQVALRVVQGGTLTVTFRDGSRDVSRTVAAPGRADEVPELTALLVGNLARDEASGLLSRLRSAGAKTAAPPALDTEAPPAEAALEPRRPLPLDGVNLSLFYPLTLLRSTEERRLALEVGLFYSRLGALSGVAITMGGVSRVDGEASGLMLGGIGYYAGGPGAGVRIGGLFGVGRESFDGIGIAPAANLHFGDYSGIELAAGVNFATGELDGVQVGAGLNLAGALSGVQAAGGLNIVSGAADGVMLAGGMNLGNGPVEGAQIAGGLNIATDPVIGAQVSAGLNYAESIEGLQLSVLNIGGDVDGLQLGIVNIARDVDGAQLGIVNVARKVEGLSVGVVPYSQEGRTQAVAWYNSNQPFNVGVRFQASAFYVMPTFGYDPDTEASVVQASGHSYSPGLSLGFRVPLGRAFADLDVNYSNRSNSAAYDEHNVDMRYRLLGGWQLAPAFAMFVGGGVRHHFRTQGPEEQSVDPELSLGVQVL